MLLDSLGDALDVANVGRFNELFGHTWLAQAGSTQERFRSSYVGKYHVLKLRFRPPSPGLSWDEELKATVRNAVEDAMVKYPELRDLELPSGGRNLLSFVSIHLHRRVEGSRVRTAHCNPTPAPWHFSPTPTLPAAARLAHG